MNSKKVQKISIIKKEVSLVEVSAYHNLLVSASSSNYLYIWDYEFMKLMSTLEIDTGTEFTCIVFLNEYPLIIAADSSGKIHILCFHRKEAFNISLKRISLIEIQTETSEQKDSGDETITPNFYNKLLIEVSNQSEDSYKMTLYASTNKGEIHIYDLSEIAQFASTRKVPHANTRMNYNSNRIAHENFLNQVEGYKIKNYFLGAKTLLVSDDEVRNNLSDDSTNKKWTLTQFKAHSDSLTTLSFIKNSEKTLLTSSLDGYIKIWTVEGQLLASLNINHPLPIIWDFKNDDISRNRKRILCSLKLIDNVMKRYKNQMLLSEQKNISVNNFLKGILSPNSTLEDDRSIQSAKTNKILLMKHEFSPRDLQFDKAKIIYQKELQGPSLRQLDVSHRLTEAQKAWKSARKNEVEKNDEISTKIKEIDDKREKNDFMKLLIGDVSRKFLTESDYSKKTQALARRLDKVSLDKEPPKKDRNHSIASSKPRESIFLTDHFNKKSLNFPPLQIAPKTPELKETHFSPEAKTSKLSLKSTELLPNSSIISPRNNIDLKTNTKTEREDLKEIQSPTTLHFRKDFIEYAKEKLNFENENDNTVDAAQKEALTEMRSDQYKRKLQNLKFKQTVTKLDKMLKLSQTSKLPLKKIPQNTSNFNHSVTEKSLTLRETPLVHLNSVFKSNFKDIKTSETEPSERSILPNLSPIPRQVAIGRIRSLDGAGDIKKIQTFRQELTGLKEYLEGNWNLKSNKNGMMKNNLSSNKSRQFESQANQSTNYTFREHLNSTRYKQNFTALEKSKTNHDDSSQAKSVILTEIKPISLRKSKYTHI